MGQKKKAAPSKAQPKTTTFLIIILVVAIIAVIAMSLSLKYNPGNQSSATTSKSTKPDEKPQPLSDEAAKTVVVTAYDRYLDSTGGTAEEAARASGIFKRTATEPVGVYIDTTTQTDPILCSKEAPERFAYSQPTRQKNLVSVIVTGEYKDKKKNTTISVQVDRTSGNIAYISCVR